MDCCSIPPGFKNASAYFPLKYPLIDKHYTSNYEPNFSAKSHMAESDNGGDDKICSVRTKETFAHILENSPEGLKQFGISFYGLFSMTKNIKFCSHFYLFELKNVLPSQL